jgi:cell division protein FtsB
MDIQALATYLLALRIVSSVALIWVIIRQIRYLRENNPPEEQRIRLALFGVTLILLGGNIIPILIDLYTIFGMVERTSNVVNTIGVIYTFNNAGFAAIAGLSWAFFYWVADREKVYLRKENQQLHQEVEDLHQEATDVKDKQDVKDVAQKKKDVAQVKKDKANDKK